MQKIVNHYMTLAPKPESCAIGHEISALRNDAQKGLSFGLHPKSSDQVGFDIKGVQVPVACLAAGNVNVP